MNKFASWRLGKSSVQDIHRLNRLPIGIQKDMPRFTVKCTQVPQEFTKGTYVFIWLGSDNNKGIATEWKQGFKAIGRLVDINRGERFNDESKSVIEIVYVFSEVFNRIDILRESPVPYYWCSAFPVIGIDDHSNQTIRMFVDGEERSDIKAFFEILKENVPNFCEDANKIDPSWEDLLHFVAPSTEGIANNIGDNTTNTLIQRKPQYSSNKRRQVIYFGAPGTGKSQAVDNIVKREAPNRNLRTTFHPDSDYASFVGCYKPTMRDGNIEYRFTAQAFINAYVEAWSDLSQPFYLVIEEINRGNCAQIFGDIFQLLDRDNQGASNYSIHPDTDLQKYIAEKLGISTNLPETIRNGIEMRLPQNLFIYATMNTSDQSLFPIDSAFKRRWDWRYTAIRPAKQDHAINVNGARYNWTSFIREVNKKILDLTKSEDKQMGYWFIKPDDNGDIDWELFVSKALFYLWNDVIKDYATLEQADSPFGRNYTFTTFFDEKGEPLADRVIAFLDALQVERIPDATSDEVYESKHKESNENDSSVNLQTTKEHKYILNSNGYDTLGSLMVDVVNTLSSKYTFVELQNMLYTSLGITRTDSKGGIHKGSPIELNRIYGDKTHNSFASKEFKSSDNVTFSVINNWQKSDFEKIQTFIESNKDVFPNGLIVNQ